MVCVLLSCTEKVGAEFKNTPLENIGENGITQLRSEVFVNNPTGRNKLVFSSQKTCLLHIRTVNTGCYIQNLLTLCNLKFLPLGFLCSVGTIVEEISYTNIWLNATMEKYVQQI
jgi:hypothetical protein